jgi:hypothetical protein
MSDTNTPRHPFGVRHRRPKRRSSRRLGSSNAVALAGCLTLIARQALLVSDTGSAPLHAASSQTYDGANGGRGGAGARDAR